MKELILDILIDVCKDTLKLLPFLFLTYSLMEYVEHKAGEKAKKRIARSGYYGPVVGALLGAVPQCGFSAAASSLYAGRVITVGTLMAVYLSTSDEMLPIFISEQVPFLDILKVIGLKVVIGLIAGLMLDFVVRYKNKGKKEDGQEIHHLCEHDHCNCEEEGILKSALHHTLQITVFIFLVSLALSFVIEFVGADSLANFVTNKPVLGELIAGLVGLVPNCAASVVITQLYLSGALSFGAMMSGLLVGAGIGVLVLLRMNEDKKKSAMIIGILYCFGVVFGILIELLGIGI
ncbi:MAG: arsenic efflux protein [Oscillospiraceae bacterium]|nr:arsenic efflux protein [Candidatus Limimonas coprohippi]MCQ2487851.1 arsenic efflux protein [Clostridia bacterium]